MAPTGTGSVATERCGREHPARTVTVSLPQPDSMSVKTAMILEVDSLVCDEASMLDLAAGGDAASVRAKRSVGVVLVGDVDRLRRWAFRPGAGGLDRSRAAGVTWLREIFRQKEGSGIIDNAQSILAEASCRSRQLDWRSRRVFLLD